MTRMEIEIEGFAGRDAERPERGPAVRVSVAHTPRARQQDGTYADGETLWVNVLSWSDEARSTRALREVRKGDLLLVRGRLTQNRWTDRDGAVHVDWQVSDPWMVARLVRPGSTPSPAPAVQPDAASAAAPSGYVAPAPASVPGWQTSTDEVNW